MNIRSFRNKGSADIALNLNTKAARKLLPTELFRIAIKAIKFIEATGSLEDLKNYRGLNCKALRGKRFGQYSVRINDQYRLCFLVQNNEILELEIIDYHGE